MSLYTLVRPAVKLMNKLPYIWKLSLVAALFLIPVAILFFGLASQIIEKTNKTERELYGLELFKRLEVISEQFEPLKDTYYISKIGDAAKVRSKLNREHQTLQASLSQLKNTDFTEQQDKRWSNAINTFSENLNRVMTDTSVGARNFSEFYSQIRLLENELIGLYNSLANISDLLNDGESDVFYLMKLMTEEIPNLKNTISYSRGIGVYATSQDAINSETYDALSDAVDGLYLHSDSIEARLSLALLQANSADDLVVNIGFIKTALDDVIRLMEDEIVEAMEVTISSNAFASKINQNMVAFDTFNSQVQEKISSLLDNRYDQLQALLLGYIAIISVSLLIILYLFLGMVLSIRMTIKDVVKQAQALADGDTTVTIEAQTKDEMAGLIQAFNSMSKGLNKLISSVRSSTNQVVESAEKMEQIADTTNESMQEQLAETENILNAVNAMNISASELAKNTGSVGESASHALSEASSGQQKVNSASQVSNEMVSDLERSKEVINLLSSQSDNIQQVMIVIKGIAEQTNLLALNAAIEAARAGEQGRGFAVVADEVRSLASRTHDSTEEIEQTIDGLQQGVKNAVSAMDSSSKRASEADKQSQEIVGAFQHIVGAVDEINQRNEQSEQTTQEQQAITAEILNRLQQIIESAQKTTNVTEVASDASHKMKDTAEDLNQLIKHFKV
jgi:methyl-accepting chemotaxis protein